MSETNVPADGDGTAATQQQTDNAASGMSTSKSTSMAVDESSKAATAYEVVNTAADGVGKDGEASGGSGEAAEMQLDNEVQQDQQQPSSEEATQTQEEIEAEERLKREELQRQAEREALLFEQRTAYIERSRARLAFLQPSRSYPIAQASLSITPVYTIPQLAVQANALDLTPCCTHVFTGGSDGYIRRYAWFPSIRQRPSSGAVLKGYWENPSISTMGALSLGDVTKARFGPASITGTVAGAVSVHSLVVQKEELYALAGSEEGVINLFGVRIDEGQVRASLGMNGKGHKRGKPVSALALTDDERGLLSGGWDAQVLEWSLDHGQCVREYVGHTAQICAILRKPAGTGPIVYDRSTSAAEPPTIVVDEGVTVAEDGTKAATNHSGEANEENGGKEALEASAGTTAQADAAINDDAASNNSYDPLFDDEGDAASSIAAQIERSARASPTAGDTPSVESDFTLPGFNLSSVLEPEMPGFPSSVHNKPQTPRAPPKKTVLPTVSRPTIPSFTDKSLPDLSEDLFLTLSVDGHCTVWDRQAYVEQKEGQQNFRTLDIPAKTPPWASSASWSPSGDKIYVGRRNATVDVYDLRQRTSKTIKLPPASGRVTAVLPLRDGSRILIGSSDALRLWNLDTTKFVIVGGNAGGATALRTDALERYLFATFGGRGWLESGREEVATFELLRSTDKSHR